MRVTILSCTVGQGHNAASRALKAYMTGQGHDVTILDTYKYVNPAIGLGMDKGYVFLGRFWPKLNERIYANAERHNGRADMRSCFPWVFADLTKSRMLRYLQEEKPDVIVSPIVMTAMMVTSLRESGMLDPEIKAVGIVTDYALHPYWEFTGMDYYVCANELMVPSMVARGIPEERILPTGIPVDPKFSRRLSRKEAREALGLDPDLETVLMSAGGMGFTGLTEAVAEIDAVPDVQVVAICGTNRMLRKKLEGQTFRNKMHVAGFVDNMDVYIDAADIIVSKPGGLSTSETIAKAKPLLLTDPMPGVENMNHAFLLNHSLAVHANDYQPLSEVIMQMRRNNLKREEMRQAQERWGKKDSAEQLGKFLESLDDGSAQEIWAKATAGLETDGEERDGNGNLHEIRGQSRGHNGGRAGSGQSAGAAMRPRGSESRHWRFEL